MINENKIARKLEKHKPKRIFLQVPEGLKTKVQDLADFLEAKGHQIFICAGPCFGACDIPTERAERLGCDLILHLGHSDFGAESKIPVVYEELRTDFDPVGLLGKNLGGINFRKIGLVSTVQYLDCLEIAKKFLEKNGKRVFIGGQILGCRQDSALEIQNGVDCFLFIGSGRFHPIGLQRKVGKPILFLDVENQKLEDLSEEKTKWERIKFARIEKAKDCRNFGVLVSTKIGQLKSGLAEEIKKKLEAKGKKAWILVMDDIRAEKLLGLKLDCLVNCACPRLTEDSGQFKKTVLDPEDVGEL